MSTVHYADPSDIQLRHALANLIAVTFSLPLRSTHLWYFLFDQSKLEDTYLPGFRVSLTGCCTVFVINVTHQRYYLYASKLIHTAVQYTESNPEWNKCSIVLGCVAFPIIVCSITNAWLCDFSPPQSHIETIKGQCLSFYYPSNVYTRGQSILICCPPMFPYTARECSLYVCM